MSLTSSGTFSHSPFTFSSPSFSFLVGFCLSFLPNEILRKDHFFLTFFGFLLPSSAAALLSFSVSSALPPFSCVLLAASESDSTAGFSVVGELTLAVALASPAPSLFAFSVLESFSFSAASDSTFFSYAEGGVYVQAQNGMTMSVPNGFFTSCGLVW